LRAETFGLSQSHNNFGWTAGLGAEMGFAPNWSAKVEYLYVDLANSDFLITGVSNGYHFGLIRAGVNYHF
jgi:outer membrane immunogenic protein